VNVEAAWTMHKLTRLLACCLLRQSAVGVFVNGGNWFASPHAVFQLCHALLNRPRLVLCEPYHFLLRTSCLLTSEVTVTSVQQARRDYIQEVQAWRDIAAASVVH